MDHKAGGRKGAVCILQVWFAASKTSSDNCGPKTFNRSIDSDEWMMDSVLTI